MFPRGKSGQGIARTVQTVTACAATAFILLSGRAAVFGDLVIVFTATLPGRSNGFYGQRFFAVQEQHQRTIHLRRHIGILDPGFVIWCQTEGRSFRVGICAGI